MAAICLQLALAVYAFFSLWSGDEILTGPAFVQRVSFILIVYTCAVLALEFLRGMRPHVEQAYGTTAQALRDYYASALIREFSEVIKDFVRIREERRWIKASVDWEAKTDTLTKVLNYAAITVSVLHAAYIVHSLPFKKGHVLTYLNMALRSLCTARYGLNYALVAYLVVFVHWWASGPSALKSTPSGVTIPPPPLEKTFVSGGFQAELNRQAGTAGDADELLNLVERMAARSQDTPRAGLGYDKPTLWGRFKLAIVKPFRIWRAGPVLAARGFKAWVLSVWAQHKADICSFITDFICGLTAVALVLALLICKVRSVLAQAIEEEERNVQKGAVPRGDLWMATVELEEAKDRMAREHMDVLNGVKSAPCPQAELRYKTALDALKKLSERDVTIVSASPQPGATEERGDGLEKHIAAKEKPRGARKFKQRIFVYDQGDDNYEVVLRDNTGTRIRYTGMDAQELNQLIYDYDVEDSEVHRRANAAEMEASSNLADVYYCCDEPFSRVEGVDTVKLGRAHKALSRAVKNYCRRTSNPDVYNYCLQLAECTRLLVSGDKRYEPMLDALGINDPSVRECMAGWVLDAPAINQRRNAAMAAKAGSTGWQASSGVDVGLMGLLYARGRLGRVNGVRFGNKVRYSAHCDEIGAPVGTVHEIELSTNGKDWHKCSGTVTAFDTAEVEVPRALSQAGACKYSHAPASYDPTGTSCILVCMRDPAKGEAAPVVQAVSSVKRYTIKIGDINDAPLIMYKGDSEEGDCGGLLLSYDNVSRRHVIVGYHTWKHWTLGGTEYKSSVSHELIEMTRNKRPGAGNCSAQKTMGAQ